LDERPPDFFDAGVFPEVDAFFDAVAFFAADLPEADFPDSRRWRRTASTRLPTPRPSRASCVGVEVDPEIFFSVFSGLSDFDEEEVSPLAVVSVASVFLESEASLLDDDEDEDDDDSDSSPPRDDDPPPTSTAAPIPISRRSFRFRHFGQVFSGDAVID
jgi:hypothetical protein